MPTVDSVPASILADAPPLTAERARQGPGRDGLIGRRGMSANE